MRLKDYIDRVHGGSSASFARKAGLPERTVARIMQGGGATIPVAAKIVRASGGKVTYRDLGPAGVRIAPKPRPRA